MPIARFQMPDGRIARFEVPEGTTPEQAQSLMSAQIAGMKTAPAPAAKPELSVMDAIKQGAGNLGAGALRGAGSIGATILWPWDKAQDMYYGDRERNVAGLITGKQPLSRNQERREAMDDGLRELGADTDSLMYKGGKLGAEIAGTAGAGGAIANGVRAALPAALAARAAPALTAIQTAGLRTGLPAASSMAGAVGNMALRSAGGAITGGASAAMIDPETAGGGAAIGAALPIGLAGAGKVGKAIGNLVRGRAQLPEEVAKIEAARAAGYVIPPTQAKPSLTNRALEGFAGKLTTAQNASARNQEITNNLAMKAIGAEELTPAGLQKVRQVANAAYDRLGRAGPFRTDQAFADALDQAGSTSAAMRQNFPGLVNDEVETLIGTMKSRPQFDAQPTIEAIKRFRADASVNKAAMDPAKKALGKAQNKIAGALEDLIDRNLQTMGSPDLLQGYRSARTVLAKTYDVEKALNSASGNVDAGKLAQALKKGRPLTDELRTIGEFASSFPKAAQTVERMGSLPGISPLDFGALGTASAATGNPMLMAGIVARPTARALALSNVVQNRLVPGTPGYLERLIQNQNAQLLLHRTAPVVGTD